MTTMADLLTAAMGGTVVAALTAAARAAGIPGDVRVHDAAIRERDNQLATWVADRDYALGRQCTAIRLKVTPGPRDAPPPSGIAATVHEDRASGAAKADRAVADARALALHEYRDQERLARIDIAQVLNAEGWAHRGYRKLPLFRRRPIRSLTTPDRAVPVLNAWRKQSSMSSGRPTWPEDATQRTLDDAIAGVRPLGP